MEDTTYRWPPADDGQTPKQKKPLPDLKKLAEAHGAETYRVIDPAKLDATICKAINSKRTTFVEVIVEPRANVYPMQPGGQPVEGMIYE